MRRFVLATAMCWMAVGAQAADMPDLPALRGGFTEGLSRSRVNWDGFYVGGQVGYESADMDFSRSIVSLSNFIFRNSVLQRTTSEWSVLTRNGAQGTSFGAFVGRNWQWDDVVVGVEANYRYVNKYHAVRRRIRYRWHFESGGIVAAAQSQLHLQYDADRHGRR